MRTYTEIQRKKLWKLSAQATKTLLELNRLAKFCLSMHKYSDSYFRFLSFHLGRTVNSLYISVPEHVFET